MRERCSIGVSVDERFKDYHLLEKMDVHTLVYYGDPAGAKRLGEHFPMLSVLLFSGKGGADIVPNGITKAEGLKELLPLLWNEHEGCCGLWRWK